MKLAPIVIFTYNRLSHTKKTIKALANNLLAKDSLVYIYSDGVRSKKDRDSVLKVRKYLKTITGFKSIKIIEQPFNKGLAQSIINGVTEIVNKYGKVIVVEDDIVTSPYFLKYMNDALNFYEKNKKVWHISGWNYVINTEYLDDVFLWRKMDCWGWATWQDRWQHFEKNPQKLIATFTDKQIYNFNIDNSLDYWAEILQNKEATLNTWAVFWDATIFLNNGLCVNPTVSFVENIGFDGSGENTGYRTGYLTPNLNLNNDIKFNVEIKENSIAFDRIKLFFLDRKKSFKLDFPKKLGLLHKNISNLKIENRKYIIYGAGSVCDIIIAMISDLVDFVVDINNLLIDSKIRDKQVYKVDKLLEVNDEYLVISVLGREKEIIQYLCSEFKINKDKIITL